MTFLTATVRPQYQWLWVELPYKCHNNTQLLFKAELCWLTKESIQGQGWRSHLSSRLMAFTLLTWVTSLRGHNNFFMRPASISIIIVCMCLFLKALYVCLWWQRTCYINQLYLYLLCSVYACLCSWRCIWCLPYKGVLARLCVWSALNRVRKALFKCDYYFIHSSRISEIAPFVDGEPWLISHGKGARPS